MKIYSSKKAAINSINVTNYRVGLYCNGKYNSDIKTMNVSSEKIVALYKSYRSDSYGSYVKIYCIEGNG
jgi:hypothetical protein